MKKLILLSLLIASNSFGMGSSLCKVIPAFCKDDPDDSPHEDLYKLQVNGGSGSGDYKEGDEVEIDAVRGDKDFVRWDGDVEHVLDPESEVTAVVMPKSDVTVSAVLEDRPEPPPPPPDFEWDLVKQYGGPNIGIAKDIASWPITRELTVVSTDTGGKLISHLGDYETAFPGRCSEVAGVSGNFAACVKQDDGKYICGTWDWCRTSYQTQKTTENLKGEIGRSFNLKKGSEICFFYTGCSRARSRNKEERSNLVCKTW